MAGQTQSEIRALLAAAGLAPQHRFGQNFLIDLNLLRKLVAAAQLCPADVVLEVGAGTGSLTEVLLESGGHVIAVEIDRGLQRILRERLGAHPRCTLVQADALAAKHEVHPLVLGLLHEHTPQAGGARKLVANLPYQIATPLVMELLYAEPRLTRLVCTIQKEVGQRLSAAPGSGSYGPVSVITQTLADVELLAIAPATAFWPRPQVESVMLALTPKPAEQVEVDDVGGFVRFVHRAFRHRRKMLRRLVRDWEPLDALALFQRAGVNPDARPEQLAPPVWRVFHRAFQQTEPR
ncbi:MAG: ribosomal RNA small subunit methyltransferase A [Planctomycetes bacterium]|nr:ribosomal RNA small subunit methyltransferase A [Planctomycetota bacterium]